ncbi:hypothetical protein [Spongiactinospora sp. TRM90649]|uniref:hypothetical protein n=1 Tax=Spongiactinospora sp. TRM90649 TaxID=3031114 RepID=UPI0023F7FFE4|nr:hypothetical protein [Spongiactinospora sp. TRM90649]MDF5758803.1 hypothetical protein [Spongiactinospora sp. TRM90649]
MSHIASTTGTINSVTLKYPKAQTSTLPLDVAERAFTLLTRMPQPISIDGEALGLGLPARPVPLDELRAILLHPSCSRTSRDEIWRHLICQARTHRGDWTIAITALAMPMLRSLTRSLDTTDREELEADVLACFMDALDRVNLTWSHPVLRLSRLTRYAVLRARAAERPQLLADPDPVEDRSLTYPAGNADLLLAEAVRQGIISAEAAELIGATRLEGVPLSAYCRRHGLLYCAVLKRRQRAENRLRQALIAGDLTGDQPGHG